MFAKITQVHEGSIVRPDAGFYCLKEGSHLQVQKDNSGDLYIHCSEGKHFIDGQIDEDVYTGLYLEKE